MYNRKGAIMGYGLRELNKFRDLAYKYRVHGIVYEYDYLKVIKAVEFYMEFLGDVLHEMNLGYDVRTPLGIFKMDRKRVLRKIRREITREDDFCRDVLSLNMMIDGYNSHVHAYNNINRRSGRALLEINCYEENRVSERDLFNQRLVNNLLGNLETEIGLGDNIGKIVTILQHPYIGKLGVIRRTTKAFATIYVLEDMVEILVKNRNFVDYFDFVEITD